MDKTERCLHSREIYEGKIITVRKDRVLLPDGTCSEREIVAHKGAVVVLPVTAANEAVLVRQYRYAVGMELLEAPAGKLEEGEDPAVCASREMKEETGYSSSRLLRLGSMFSSPGFCDELMHMYLALDISEGEACPDVGEFIETVQVPLQTLYKMISVGQIRDAKTIAVALLAKEHLRGEHR